MELSTRSAEFVKEVTANAVESINNSIATNVPKRLDFPRSYSTRADAGILNHDIGPTWKAEAMEELGHQVSQATKISLEKKEKERQKDLKRKKSPEYKKSRRKNKKAKKERNKSLPTQAQYQYKEEGSYNSEKNTSKKIPASCGCKGGEKKQACLNATCSCVKAKRGCSSSCKCKACNNVLK